MLKYENLIGREFALGKADCFAMVIDFYKQNFDIDIPNFARPTNWDSDTIDLIGMLYKQAGFEKIDTWDLRPGDLLAAAIGTSHPNHLIIYVGDNTLLHHKLNARSASETFRPAYKMFTCYVLRHPDVPDLTVAEPVTTIESVLRERYFNM